MEIKMIKNFILDNENILQIIKNRSVVKLVINDITFISQEINYDVLYYSFYI